MQIIGLSGYARSGKDTAAEVLVEQFGFTRVAFADKLREVLYELNPIVDFLGREVAVEDGYIDNEILNAAPVTGGIHPIGVKDVINRFGWDGYKETKWSKEIRRLLQRLGTEAGRQTLWDSIWVDAALTGLPEDAKVVVTDCRFVNEAQAIKDRAGIVVRVERAGVGPANNHPSETSLDDWDFDYTLPNVHDLETFKINVEVLHDVYQSNEYFKHVIGDH